MRRPQPFRPIPGTEAPNRGLFIDRWGTLIDAAQEHLGAKDRDFAFFPRALDAVFRAHRAGWRIYLIGNERGVAEGRVPEAHWLEHEAELLRRMTAHGVSVARNYACLDHPQGQGARRKPSVFLFPDTGVFYHAMQMDGVQLEHCWVIGDGTLELSAGERAGLRTAGLRCGRGMSDRELHVEPHLIAEDLADFVATLLGPRIGATRV